MRMDDAIPTSPVSYVYAGFDYKSRIDSLIVLTSSTFWKDSAQTNINDWAKCKKSKKRYPRPSSPA